MTSATLAPMPIGQIIALITKLIPAIILIIQAAQDHQFTVEEIKAIITEILKAFGVTLDAQGDKLVAGFADGILALSKLKLPSFPHV